MSIDALQFPLGLFAFDAAAAESHRIDWIESIRKLPEDLRTAVEGLSDRQLDIPYRRDGWTARQVVHHLADSHMNCFIRMKLALTENVPVIKPYDEAAWAETPDTTMPVAASLDILSGLHARWSMLLGGLEPAAFGRMFQHPESGLWTLDRALAFYAWHGRHHLAHVTLASRQRS